jgi:hypothetical protein
MDGRLILIPGIIRLTLIFIALLYDVMKCTVRELVFNMITFYQIIYGIVDLPNQGVDDFLAPNLWLDVDNWLW